MRKRPFALLLILLLALPFALSAQNAKKKKKAEQDPEGQQVVNLPPATIAGEIPGDRASDPGKQADWPAIAYAADGSLYAIYIEWNDKDADRVVVRRRDPSGAWGRPVPIDDGNWDHYSPALVAHGHGALAIWSGQSDGNYDLYAAEVTPNGAAKPARLTRAPYSDFNARAVADSAGNVTLVWQSFRAGTNSDIYARRLSGSHWGAETRISTSDSNDWDPDEILRVDVVKDGKYVYTTRPSGRNARISYRDNGAQPGKSYYYVRVFERDTDEPDGDPEIAWSSPFYVTYR